MYENVHQLVGKKEAVSEPGYKAGEQRIAVGDHPYAKREICRDTSQGHRHPEDLANEVERTLQVLAPCFHLYARLGWARTGDCGRQVCGLLLKRFSDGREARTALEVTLSAFRVPARMVLYSRGHHHCITSHVRF